MPEDQIPWQVPAISLALTLFFLWSAWRPSRRQKFLADQEQPLYGRVRLRGRIMAPEPVMVMQTAAWFGGTDTSSPIFHLDSPCCFSVPRLEFRTEKEILSLNLEHAALNDQVIQSGEQDESDLEARGWRRHPDPDAILRSSFGIRKTGGWQLWSYPLLTDREYIVTGWREGNVLKGESGKKPLLLLDGTVPRSSVVRLTEKGRSETPSIPRMIAALISGMAFLGTLTGFIISLWKS